jgi:hypothetical protein
MIEVSPYSLRNDGTGIDVKFKALRHGKKSSKNLLVYQLIRRDVEGTDNYHDKAYMYFLEAWSLERRRASSGVAQIWDFGSF